MNQESVEHMMERAARVPALEEAIRQALRQLPTHAMKAKRILTQAIRGQKHE